MIVVRMAKANKMAVVMRLERAVKREPRREKRPPMPMRISTAVATTATMKRVDIHFEDVCW